MLMLMMLMLLRSGRIRRPHALKKPILETALSIYNCYCRCHFCFTPHMRADQKPNVEVLINLIKIS